MRVAGDVENIVKASDQFQRIVVQASPWRIDKNGAEFIVVKIEVCQPAKWSDAIQRFSGFFTAKPGELYIVCSVLVAIFSSSADAGFADFGG